MSRDLEGLNVALKKAEKDVREAKLKRVLNFAVSAVTLLIAPEEALVAWMVASGAITTHLILDQTLGHPSLKGTVVTELSDGVEFVEKFKNAAKKFVGVAGAVITLKLDSDEVGEAKKIVKELQDKFKSTLKTLQRLLSGLVPLERDLPWMEARLKALRQEVEKALTKSNNAARNYDAIRNLIKKAL